MTDKEKGHPWTAFTVEDEKGHPDIYIPGNYAHKLGKHLDPDNPEDKVLIEDLQNAARAFRIAEEQINPDRLKETAQHMRENMPLVDLIVPAFLHHLLEPFRDKVENGDGTETIDFDIENPPEWYDPSKTYDINADKAIERATNAVRAYVEETQDFWEDTAEYVWVHLMAHTLLEMVNKYGGWDELLELPDLEDQFNKWLLEDEHMGPFADRYEDIVKMYADIKAHQMAEAIEGEGDLLMEALAFEPVPDHSRPWIDLEGNNHFLTDLTPWVHKTKVALAAAKENFTTEGDGLPMVPEVRLKARPPYDSFDESLLSPDEMAVTREKMWEIVRGMNDITADLLDIIINKHMESGAKPHDAIRLDLNEVLAMRGIKPKTKGEYTAGYREEDYHQITRHLNALYHIWIDEVKREFFVIEEGENGKQKRTHKQEYYRGPIITFAGEQGRRDVESGLYEKREFSLILAPAFAEVLASRSPAFGPMSRNVLEYHPLNQSPEKRLSRWLAHVWRSRQDKADYMKPFKVSTLLKEAGIKIPDRNKTRAVERLDKALNTLVDNGDIAGWEWVNWDESQITRKKVGGRTWDQRWLNVHVVIEPPPITPTYYRERIADKGTEKKKQRQEKQVGEIGQAIRAKRTAEGLSMSQLAEQLDVSPSQVSRWEAGKTNPRGKGLKKIQAWLGGGQK